MAKLYFDNGIELSDLEKGIEFRIDDKESFSDSEEFSFDDDRFDEYNSEMNEVTRKSKEYMLPFNELREIMTPVTADGCVMKQCLKWGVGIPLPEKAIVLLHYDAFLENEKQPFDSTRLRQRPYKFLTGGGNVIPGLELGIQTMKKGEVSKFLVSPEYAYGDMGCPPRIPGHAEIMYIVEILNFYESEAAVEFEEMTPEDQKKAPFEKIVDVFHCEHQMGNELFRNKHYKQAIARYRKMVRLLEDVSVENEEQDDKRKQYLLKLYLNLAQSYINDKHSSKAIIYADLALKLDPTNPKGLYRKGMALFIGDDFDRAEFYLLKAKKHKPYENSINKVLLQLDRKRKEYFEWEKIFSKKIFSSETPVDKETIKEPDAVAKMREKVEKEIKKFIDSSERELSFSPNCMQWEMDILDELAREHKLAFINKIQDGEIIIKIAK